MKTFFSLLLLFSLVSCARRPSSVSHPTSTSQATAPTFAAPPATVEPHLTTVPVEVTAPQVPYNTTNAVVVSVPTNTPYNPNATAVVPPRPPAPPAVTPPAYAVSSSTIPGADQVLPAGMIDFRNMPLEQVLDVYAELVGRTLLRPAALPAQQITLKTQTQLTKAEAVQALDAVLGLNGITMINVGEKFVKVSSEAQANQMGAPRDARSETNMPELGPYVYHVVQLKYVKPTEIMPVLAPFAKLPSSILPIDSSQILVLRDYTENVKRMLEMIREVDVIVPAEFISEVIPIKYAKANEIADALNSLSGSGGGGGASGSRAPTSSGAARPGGGAAAARSSMPGYAQPGGAPTTPGGAGAPAQNNFSANLQRIIQRASGNGDLQLFGQMKMIADERSNSLLIFASRSDMETIKNIISKLDVVLSQVLIETIIMDVSLSDAKALGFSAVQTPQNFNDAGTSAGAGGMNAQQFFNNFATSGGDSNVFSQLLGTGLRYFAKVDKNYYLQLQAAASQGRVNVIQKPRILTSHARPGSIFIGSTVPYVTGTSFNGGYGGPSSTYQQLSVGIGLDVTPYINPDGLVVMQIDETIDELAGSTDITGVGAVPNTTHRTLSAEVAVRDGDSVILGGFIRNSTTKNNSGVPLLKDIPLLGALFSSRSSSKDRSELLVLMRPTVLKTPEIAAIATFEEKKHLPGIVGAEIEARAVEDEEMAKAQKNADKHPEPPRKPPYTTP